MDHLEVHQDVQVDHVEVLDQADQADHHEIVEWRQTKTLFQSFQEVDVDQDLVLEVLAEVDHQVHLDLLVDQVDH